MVITRFKLRVIFIACLLLNLGGMALAHRIAFFSLCPQPGITLEAFDIMRAGMSRQQVLAKVQPKQLLLELAAASILHGPLVFKGDQVWHFRGDDIELELDTRDGIVTDGRATVRGRLVRSHLQPHDPIADTARVGLVRLEAAMRRNQPIEWLSYTAACVAGISLATMLALARRATAVRPKCEPC